ncbi:predicted protein [Pyrenophora tritici-repentis Pt-1C-BFP]|uniref:Uncharacterized protein n=1 Tax=Pyrenophora tritici-repentis (strain Pt-1C-BFP) TaxID=426418 RepID=B2W6K1_PYRTR|nr:uncharacterized protein PTRG_05439 [Pyrenophora tritici-repentis Pt-1C-BFP]EDU48359.1 predicted protein [Pyrenophora tritici-repentis Pt-1C-BFP]
MSAFNVDAFSMSPSTRVLARKIHVKGGRLCKRAKRASHGEDAVRRRCNVEVWNEEQGK